MIKKKETEIGKNDFSKLGSQMLNNISKLLKKEKKLSQVIDFVVEEAMPTIFQENITIAYQKSMKQIDYFMRHLI